jgi:DNA-binding transcriptional LysR family regulator
MHSFRHLEIIQALAVHKNFGRAASAIGMSQPVLSRTLAHIEKELGVQLFERIPGGAEPTIFGQIIIDRCSATLGEIYEALREIRLVQGLDAGSLKIAAGAFPSEISVQTAVGVMASKFPALNIELSTVLFGQARRDVIDGRADIAVGDISDLPTNGHPELDIEPLRPRMVQFCCRSGHPMLERTSIGISDLFDFPMVGVAWPIRTSQFLPEDVSKAGTIDREDGYFTPRIVVNTLRSALAIARRSDVTTFVHPSYIEPDIRSGTLVLVPVQLPWMTLNYGFVTRKGRRWSPAAHEFKKHVLQIEAGID